MKFCSVLVLVLVLVLFKSDAVLASPLCPKALNAVQDGDDSNPDRYVFDYMFSSSRRRRAQGAQPRGGSATTTSGNPTSPAQPVQQPTSKNVTPVYPSTSTGVFKRFVNGSQVPLPVVANWTVMELTLDYKTLVYTSDYGPSISLMDIATGVHLLTVNSAAYIRHLLQAQSGKNIFAVSDNGQVSVLESAPWRVIHSYRTLGTNNVALSPDGKTLAVKNYQVGTEIYDSLSGGHKIRLPLPTSKFPRTSKVDGRIIGFSLDSRTLVRVYESDDLLVFSYPQAPPRSYRIVKPLFTDVQTGQALPTNINLGIFASSSIKDAISKDGKFVAFTGVVEKPSDVSSKIVVAEISGRTEVFRDILFGVGVPRHTYFSDDSKYLIVVGARGVAVYRTFDWSIAFTFDHGADFIENAKLLADQSLLISIGVLGKVRVHEFPSGIERQLAINHPGFSKPTINDVDATAQGLTGGLIVTVGSDQVAHVVDSSKGQVWGDLNHAGQIDRVIVTPDGKHIITRSLGIGLQRGDLNIMEVIP